MRQRSSPFRLAMAAVLVIGLPVAVVLVRLALDATVSGRGWHAVAFLAILLAARVGGAATGLAATAVLATATWLVVPDPATGTSAYSDLADGIADAVIGTVATGVALALRLSSRETRASQEEADRATRRLVEAARREATIRELAAELGPLDSPRQIADVFVRRVAGLLGARSVSLHVRAEDVPSVTVPLGSPLAGPTTSLAVIGDPPADGTLARVVDGALEQRRPVVERVERAERDAGPQPGPTLLRAVGVPLLAGTGIRGAAAIVLEPPRELEPAAVDSLATLGRLAAEALARAADAESGRRDRSRAEVSDRRIARLQRLAADLAGQLDPTTVGRIVVDAAADGARASVVVLHRVVAARDRLELLASRGYPSGLVARERVVPLAARLPAAEAARSRKVVTVDATAWADRFPGASDVPSIAGVAALAAIPVGSGPRAVLLAGRPSPGPFASDELRYLEAVAEQGAQALERADLLEALRDRDRRLDLTLGAARTGSWELDLESGRLSTSAEFGRIHALPPGAGPADLAAYLERVHVDDRERVRETLERVAAAPGSFEIEFRAARADGWFAWIRSVGRSFPDDTGHPRVLMATDRDVTLDRAAEAERERLLEQEREARRLQDAFVGVMSHELRTPITTILAGTKLLLRDRTLSAATRDLAVDVGDEAERLYRLVEDLLVLSRVERGGLTLAREPVHLGHLLERVVASESRRWPTRFDVRRARDQEVVEGEETYVEQVLRNLLSNAAKYSPVDSTVEVRVEPHDGEVHVRVLDDGVGIAGDEIGDLFTLFYRSPQTAAAASGAGIGLFVCDRLIRAMGGRIWAQRREAGGSEFGFALRGYAEVDVELDVEPPRSMSTTT